jgi:hypothetical protein
VLRQNKLRVWQERSSVKLLDMSSGSARKSIGPIYGTKEGIQGSQPRHPTRPNANESRDPRIWASSGLREKWSDAISPKAINLFERLAMAERRRRLITCIQPSVGGPMLMRTSPLHADHATQRSGTSCPAKIDIFPRVGFVVLGCGHSRFLGTQPVAGT